MKIKKYQEPDGPIKEKNNEGWHETLDESGVTAIRNRKTLDGDYSVEMGNLMRHSDLMEHDPRLRKKYLKSRNKDFKMWEPFYRQFAGTEYNQIWENFLQNYQINTLSNLVTPDSQIFWGIENIPEDFWEKHTDYYINNMPEYGSRAYKKQTEYVDLYPLTYDMSDDDKLAKRVIKKNITKPAKFLSRLYRTPKALIGTWLANRYAKQQGAPKYMLKYDPVENVSLNGDSMLTSNYNSKTGHLNLGAQGKDIMDVSISNVLAHEMAHTRKLYNTQDIERDADGNLINKRDDSKYYNMIYDYIDPRYKALLAPTVDVDNNHDSELSEHYSDLLALRMGLRNAGINRGWRLYTNRDIEKFLNTYAGSQDRYLRYHTDLKNVRKALNRIWKDGGKLK